jgi:hypothetical protein
MASRDQDALRHRRRSAARRHHGRSPRHACRDPESWPARLSGAHHRRDRISPMNRDQANLFFPGHRQAIRARHHDRHFEPTLWPVGSALRRQRHARRRAPGPPAAPRPHRSDTGRELPTAQQAKGRHLAVGPRRQARRRARGITRPVHTGVSNLEFRPAHAVYQNSMSVRERVPVARLGRFSPSFGG